MSSIVLELFGDPHSVLLPTGLESIVRLLEPMRDDLAFSVLAFDGVLKETTRTPYEDVRLLVSSSERGLELGWDDLVRLAEDTFDVWDFLLVGYSNRGRPPARGTFEELASASEVAIELFDSGSLRLSVKSEALAQRATAAFPALRPAPRTSPG